MYLGASHWIAAKKKCHIDSPRHLLRSSVCRSTQSVCVISAFLFHQQMARKIAHTHNIPSRREARKIKPENKWLSVSSRIEKGMKKNIAYTQFQVLRDTSGDRQCHRKKREKALSDRRQQNFDMQFQIVRIIELKSLV